MEHGEHHDDQTTTTSAQGAGIVDAPEAVTGGPAPNGAKRPQRHRQAIVVIHGMGEQRPVETLNAFSTMIANGSPFHSRPSKVGDYEARMHVIPPTQPGDGGEGAEFDVQTDIYEYHWAHLMQGNRLDDLWPTFRRVMFPVTGIMRAVIGVALLGLIVLGLAWASGVLVAPTPWAAPALIAASAIAVLALMLPLVPPGLIGLWVVVWAAVFALVWAFMAVPAVRHLATFDSPIALIGALFAGSASAIAVVAYLASRVLPGWLVKSFVDVVRYLDTSPRSYDARHEIRKGIVDLLQGLHDSDKGYSRIIVAAHSLGSYIGYDAISYLWTVRNERFTLDPADVADLESAAADLHRGWAGRTRFDFARRWERLARVRDAYRDAQRRVWRTQREAGHPWLITDFVTFGSPMNFADRIFTRSWAEFDDRIARRELVTCPPVSERATAENRGLTAEGRTGLIWPATGSRKRRLHEAAPFAVVRWTNLWYPARYFFFGDWFGGPLARLYGPAVEDVRLDHASAASRIPGYAHAVYLREGTRSRPVDLRRPGSFGVAFERALDLRSLTWLPARPVRTASSATSRSGASRTAGSGGSRRSAATPSRTASGATRRATAGAGRAPGGENRP
ncbi:hypothetical protein [Agromyces bracchium]|uniref:hypothetical protein n=1 Tax=Agromyces bracchium TaxID=88376 RepID=UPI0018ACE4C9|nr:hypothetical protein [Agromyces bracchium]